MQARMAAARLRARGAACEFEVVSGVVATKSSHILPGKS